MAAADSFVGEGLNPSPHREALAEIERLQSALQTIAEYVYEWRFHGAKSRKTIMRIGDLAAAALAKAAP